MEKFDRANYALETTLPNDSAAVLPREVPQKCRKFRERSPRPAKSLAAPRRKKKSLPARSRDE
jgi:hypothetical protein